MANRTDPLSRAVHGTDPQNLIEKILRTRIYDSRYWKEHCFALTAESLVDKAVELDAVGGTYSHNNKPTPFICLACKMLQIQPDKDIIVEFLQAEDYKYVRALGAFYLRLTGRPADIYKYLEPLLADYAKIATRGVGGWGTAHLDEFIDELLTSSHACGIALPHLPPRVALEEAGYLEPRKSLLGDELDDIVDPAENSAAPAKEANVKGEDAAGTATEPGEEGDVRSPRDDTRRRGRSRSRSRSRDRGRRRHRSRSRSDSRDSRHRNRRRHRSRSRRHRSRSRSDSDDSRRRGRSRRHRRRSPHSPSDSSRSRSPARRSRERRSSRRSRSRSRSRSGRRPERRKKSKQLYVKGLKKKPSAAAAGPSASDAGSGGAGGTGGGGGSKESLSVEETNRVRAQLGLKPLKE